MPESGRGGRWGEGCRCLELTALGQQLLDVTYRLLDLEQEAGDLLAGERDMRRGQRIRVVVKMGSRESIWETVSEIGVIPDERIVGLPIEGWRYVHMRTLFV